jgi:hypothetical protein
VAGSADFDGGDGNAFVTGGEASPGVGVDEEDGEPLQPATSATIAKSPRLKNFIPDP